MRNLSLCTLLCCLLFSNASLFSQEKHIYQRIRVPQHGITKLLESDVDVNRSSCYSAPNGDLIMEIRKLDVEAMRADNINLIVTIPNLTKFYKDRLKDTRLPDSVLHHLKLKKEVPKDWDYGSIGGYLSLDEIYDHMDNMAEKYPDLVSIRQPIGDFRTQHDRPIYHMFLSDNPNQEEQGEEEVLITGAHHAREMITPHIVIYYMYYLLENYKTNEEVKRLVDELRITFIPCLNPDGYHYNCLIEPEGGGMWRKNLKLIEGEKVGVDLNRNYGFNWGYNNHGSSPNPQSEVYRGPSAFSEPETQAMRYLCDSHHYRSALNYHSYGNLLIFPYGYDFVITPDDEKYKAMSEKMTSVNNYWYGQVFDLIGYSVNGDANDWLYFNKKAENYSCMAFTPEVGSSFDGFYPEFDRILPLIQENVSLISTLLDISIIESPVGITDNMEEKGYCIYPQPSQSGQAISIQSANPLHAIKIANLEGKIIHSQSLDGGKEIQIKQKLPSGIYLLFLEDEDRSEQVEKIIIH